MVNEVNSFVGNLVEMAKAYEALPSVQQALNEANETNSIQAQTITRLEARIMDLKSEIDAAHADRRKVEAERDDAELRFLEADEKLDKAASAFRVALEAMDHADHVIEEATAKPEPISTPQGQSEADPTDTAQMQSATSEASLTSSISSSASIADSDFGHPVDAMSSGPVEVAAQPNPIPAPEPMVPRDSSGEASSMAGSVGTDKPYAGKLYRNVPGYVTFPDWIAGGGTERDYYARPEPSVASSQS